MVPAATGQEDGALLEGGAEDPEDEVATTPSCGEVSSLQLIGQNDTVRLKGQIFEVFKVHRLESGICCNKCSVEVKIDYQ